MSARNPCPAPGCVLFVANDAPASRRAREALAEAARQAAADASMVDVVDVHLAPRRALQAGCMATPSLLLTDAAGRATWYVGDLSNAVDLAATLRSLQPRVAEE